MYSFSVQNLNYQGKWLVGRQVSRVRPTMKSRVFADSRWFLAEKVRFVRGKWAVFEISEFWGDRLYVITVWFCTNVIFFNRLLHVVIVSRVSSNRKMILGGPTQQFWQKRRPPFCAAILNPKNVLISALDICDVVYDITAKITLDHKSTKRF